MSTQAESSVHLPRVEIKFCVQCKWNLRAAYYAQELLQTFSNAIGEIALVPVSGGIFTITLTHIHIDSSLDATPHTKPESELNVSQSLTSPLRPAPKEITTTQIWDLKTDGGFPETKELKNRIRNLIAPDKDMGHIDRSLKKNQTMTTAATTPAPAPAPAQEASTSTSAFASIPSHPATQPKPPAQQSTLTSTSQPTTIPPSSTSTAEQPLTIPSSTTTATTTHSATTPTLPTQTHPLTTAHSAPSASTQDHYTTHPDTTSMHDCEECRLEAMETLEDEIGRVTSYQQQRRGSRWE